MNFIFYCSVFRKSSRPTFARSLILLFEILTLTQNFEITNIKIKKNELLDNFIFELVSFIFQKLFEYPKYLIIPDIVKY